MRRPSREDLISTARERRRESCLGAFIGLAVGDALGTTLEFSDRDSEPPVTDMVGGGPFHLAPGQWTDDTSMALGLAESLLQFPGLDAADCTARWSLWMNHGENSCTGTCFDVGNQTRRALGGWRRGEPPAPTESAGNGAIMRLAPAFVRWHGDRDEACRIAIGQSRLTHNNPLCDQAAAGMVDALFQAMEQGEAARPGLAPDAIRARRRSEIRSTGFVVDTMEAALWSVARSGNFREAVLTAVNLGDDADTVGAVTGQIAGALWGLSGIPAEWRRQLAWADRIETLATRLFDAGISPGGKGPCCRGSPGPGSSS